MQGKSCPITWVHFRFSLSTYLHVNYLTGKKNSVFIMIDYVLGCGKVAVKYVVFWRLINGISNIFWVNCSIKPTILLTFSFKEYSLTFKITWPNM